MYNYLLHWADMCEDSCSIPLSHTVQWSKEEFDNIIKSAIPGIMAEIPEDDLNIFNPMRFTEELARVLIRDFNFVNIVPVEYEQTFFLAGLGWSGVFRNLERSTMDVNAVIESSGYHLKPYFETQNDDYSIKYWKKNDASS